MPPHVMQFVPLVPVGLTPRQRRRQRKMNRNENMAEKKKNSRNKNNQDDRKDYTSPHLIPVLQLIFGLFVSVFWTLKIIPVMWSHGYFFGRWYAPVSLTRDSRSFFSWLTTNQNYTYIYLCAWKFYILSLSLEAVLLYIVYGR